MNSSYEGKADEGEKLHHKPKIEYVGSILAKEAAKIADEYNRDDHYLFHTPESKIFEKRINKDKHSTEIISSFEVCKCE